MKEYKVIFMLDGEERSWTCETDSAESASDACYYEFSDEGEGYEQIRVIEL